MTKFKMLRNKNWLKHQYSELGKTTIQIAKEIGCGHNAVWKSLKKFGIKIGKRQSHSKFKKGHKFNIGKKNPRWNGGKIKNNKGYILVYCPDHPYAYDYK